MDEKVKDSALLIFSPHLQLFACCIRLESGVFTMYLDITISNKFGFEQVFAYYYSALRQIILSLTTQSCMNI